MLNASLIGQSILRNSFIIFATFFPFWGLLGSFILLLNLFFKKYKINLRVEKNYFPISKNKFSRLNVKYSASFGRQLEYYTGLVFKIDIKIKSNKINIINGGRYDNLIGDLGSNKKIPAVGAAINLND